MPASWNIEWLNANAERAFPFKEDVSRQDVNAVVLVPNRLLVDLVFVVPAGTSFRYYLKTLMYSGFHVNLVFADEDDVTIGSITVDLAVHNRNDAYTINGEGIYSGAVGRIAIGDLSDLQNSIPEGVYSFELAATELEMRTVRPDLRSVYSLAVIGADGVESDQITGIVRLVSGQNIQLTYVPATDITPAGIRIDAVDNPDYDEDCDCDAEVKPLPPIRSINGVSGDETNGRVDLIPGSPCLTISAGGDTLTLTDHCSQPCCGCPELELITDRLKLLDDSVSKLESQFNQLDANEQEFYRNVLESLK